MKAAVFEDIGRIVVRDVPQPAPADHTLVLRVAACAICGTDARTFRHGKSNVKPPQIIGHEIAGTVHEAGKKGNGFAVGDRVAVAAINSCGECYYCTRGMQNLCENFSAIGYEHPGGFAEYMEVPGRMIRDGSTNHIPENLDFARASLAEPFACAINGQELSRVSLGDTVVIIGAGPIGCMHIELARARGATAIIVVEQSAERLELARRFNADLYCRADGGTAEEVLRFTGGRGADVVIVAASAGKAQETGLLMTAPKGRLNLFGGLPKDNSLINLDINVVHYREVFVHGTSGSLPRHNRMALDLFSSGRVDAGRFITHTLGLNDIVRGIELVENKKALKVVINPWLA